MKIGISILITQGFNIWSNGLNQNILFLAQTLRASGVCSEVVLINCGDSEFPADQVNLDEWGVRVIAQHEIVHLGVAQRAGAVVVQGEGIEGCGHGLDPF